MKKFKVGDRFDYVAGGLYTYHCKVLEINKYGNPRCSTVPEHNTSHIMGKEFERTYLLRSFVDGTRTLVDTDYKEKPLTEKEEYEEVWV